MRKHPLIPRSRPSGPGRDRRAGERAVRILRRQREAPPRRHARRRQEGDEEVPAPQRRQEGRLRDPEGHTGIAPSPTPASARWAPTSEGPPRRRRQGDAEDAGGPRVRAAARPVWLVAVDYVVFQAAWDANHTKPPKLFGHEFMLQTAPNRFGLTRSTCSTPGFTSTTRPGSSSPGTPASTVPPPDAAPRRSSDTLDLPGAAAGLRVSTSGGALRQAAGQWTRGFQGSNFPAGLCL